MFPCSSCGYQIDLSQTKTLKEIEFQGPLIKVHFENARGVICPKCDQVNICSQTEWRIPFVEALMRESANLPICLNGRQAAWARDFLAFKTATNEKFAVWLGFKNFSNIKKWGLEEERIDVGSAWEREQKNIIEKILTNEIYLLLARKFGFSNASVFDDWEKTPDDPVPEDVDRKIKEMLLLVGDSGQFPSRTEFIDGYYVISIRLVANLIDAKSEEILRKELKNINRLFAQAGIRRLNWPAFEKLIKDGVNRITLSIDLENGEEAVIGVAFCFFYWENHTLIAKAEKLVLDRGFLGEEQVVYKFFHGILVHCLERGAKTLLLKKPKQIELVQTAEAIGFKKLKTGWYIIRE